MKLNSDEQTLAESKVLLLYILNKVGKAISHNELLELVSSVSDMNYFYFEQFLLDLLEDIAYVAGAVIDDECDDDDCEHCSSHHHCHDNDCEDDEDFDDYYEDDEE